MALLSPSPDKINLNIKIEISNFPIHASCNNIFIHLFTRFCHKLLFKETFSPLYKREIQILPFYVLFIPRSRIINLQCNNHPPLLPQLLPQRTEQLTFPYLTPSCMRRWQHARKKKEKTIFANVPCLNTKSNERGKGEVTRVNPHGDKPRDNGTRLFHNATRKLRVQRYGGPARQCVSKQ